MTFALVAVLGFGMCGGLIIRHKMRTVQTDAGGIDAGAWTAGTLPPEPPPPGTAMASELPGIESELLADPVYKTIWSDPTRKEDVELLLTSVSQVVEGMNKDGTFALDAFLGDMCVKKKFVTGAKGAKKAGGALMLLAAFVDRKGVFPNDFVDRTNTFLAAVALEPHLGVWAPATESPKDFSALAYFLHPKEPKYLREFIAAKSGSRFVWADAGGVARKDPLRPYLAHEREALERLSLLTPLTTDEEATKATGVSGTGTGPATTSTPSPAATCSTHWAMVSECKEQVSSMLKAPSQAEFPGILDVKIDVDPVSCKNTFRSWVDAPNDFGTMLRRTYTCTYDPKTDALSVKFGE